MNKAIDMRPTSNKSGKPMPIEIHHADNMVGSGIHEVRPAPKSAIWDARLHWQLRGQQMGNVAPNN